jgi:hypothetical protein
MTLQTPQPPPSALRAVLAALDDESTHRRPAAAVLRSTPGPLLPAHPLAVYVLEGTALASARRTGWRFLIKHGTAGVVAAAEVSETPGVGHTFAHFAAGPYLDSTVQALRQAWQLAQGSRIRRQPRLLSMPGHYATALWLTGPEPGGADDLLIPLSPAPLGVTAHRVYQAGELLTALDRPEVDGAPLLLGRG